jgi:hypothetical protein
VRATTAGNLLLHAAVDVAIVAAGFGLHLVMLQLLNRRLRANFGRGHAARVETSPRWTSRAVGLTFGLAYLAFGSLFTVAPVALDAFDALSEGEGLSSASLRAAACRRGAGAALLQADVRSADRLIRLARREDNANSTVRLDAEVALRLPDPERAERDLQLLEGRKSDVRDLALLNAQLKLIRGDCRTAVAVLESLARNQSVVAVRAYHDLAVAHARCGEDEEASQMIDAHLGVHPRDPVALRNRARLAAGETQLEFSAPRDWSPFALR